MSEIEGFNFSPGDEDDIYVDNLYQDTFSEGSIPVEDYKNVADDYIESDDEDDYESIFSGGDSLFFNDSSSDDDTLSKINQKKTIQQPVKDDISPKKQPNTGQPNTTPKNTGTYKKAPIPSQAASSEHSKHTQFEQESITNKNKQPTESQATKQKPKANTINSNEPTKEPLRYRNTNTTSSGTQQHTDEQPVKETHSTENVQSAKNTLNERDVHFANNTQSTENERTTSNMQNAENAQSAENTHSSTPHEEHNESSTNNRNTDGTLFTGAVVTESDTKKYDWLHLNEFFIGLTKGGKAFIVFSVVLFLMVSSVYIFSLFSGSDDVVASTTTEQENFLSNYDKPFDDLISYQTDTEIATENTIAEIPITEFAAESEPVIEAAEPVVQSEAVVVQGSDKFSSVSELTLYIQKAAATVGEKQLSDIKNLTDGYLSREDCLSQMNTYSVALDELSTLLLLNQSLYSVEEFQELSALVSRQVQFSQTALSLLNENAPLSDFSALLGN